MAAVRGAGSLILDVRCGSEPMVILKRIYLYGALLPCSALLFALAWIFIAPGHLYYCWDDAPPFVISWFPPFNHPWANSLDGRLRDYYIWPEWTVYTVWILLAVGIFLLPAILVWRFVNDESWIAEQTDCTEPRVCGLSNREFQKSDI